MKIGPGTFPSGSETMGIYPMTQAEPLCVRLALGISTQFLPRLARYFGDRLCRQTDFLAPLI
jgi:hypothetical protein